MNSTMVTVCVCVCACGKDVAGEIKKNWPSASPDSHSREVCMLETHIKSGTDRNVLRTRHEIQTLNIYEYSSVDVVVEHAAA